MSGRSSPQWGVWSWVERHQVATLVLAVGAFVAMGTVLEEEPRVHGGVAALPEYDDRPAGSVVVPDEPGEPPDRPAVARSAARAFLVVRVVDGDTLELGNGETVRLVGIVAPAAGECGYMRAARRLAALVEGRQVMLGKSGENRDGVGLMLRYVDVGRHDAGLRLVREGLATARDGTRQHRRERSYLRADRSSPDLSCTDPEQAANRPAPARARGFG